ncbi:enoyl-CoA hydratase/carnithine racemase [Bradyrhizobium sp. R2.2-H]|jgi:enoyl-CoA hydratase/carnithine racemase|uniref:enoyl-CoA hydratase/isomerase family protein n=1 Tax=unclassified Bradyrhizobium TaxID=2631580 RepID=UPI0010D9F02D|nr:MULTISPECIES: enoyl-CoA hydratase/isomerase family protein [unclassified Bradyrhizobium]TCU68192.1 enoyl-CoA hydratase/carnithine racemase [Bradyrhizobium sp. Y-H1]TCU70186.1 enoyl-CoA hydratase/carnithine racemase [Bradyrhizobium sp. R2.2-H]
MSSISKPVSSCVKVSYEGPVAVLSMESAPHNLIGFDLMGGIREGLASAREAGSRAVLLKSGLRHFSAGADTSLFERSQGPEGRVGSSSLAFLRDLENFPLPIVAAVQGVCVGGGFELALACDFIIAARSAKIGSVEATLGLNPLMGAIQRQVQRAGIARAKEMSMLGRRYDAATLEKWNIINLVVDDEKLGEAAMMVALELGNGPTLAHTSTKQIANLAAAKGVEAADEAMAQLQRPLWTSDDLNIGLESLMKQGPGLAVFKGR